MVSLKEKKIASIFWEPATWVDVLSILTLFMRLRTQNKPFFPWVYFGMEKSIYDKYGAALRWCL